MTEEHKGELFIFFKTFLWAFFPIVTILSFGKLPSLLALAWSTLFACLFFLVLVIGKKLWHEMKNVLLWKYVLVVVISISVLFYGLFFAGLTYTTAGNGSIIGLFEVFTSFLFFHLIRREYISKGHILGTLLMVLGAVIVLVPNFHSVNKGDLLILLATFCAPVGNLYQQKAKKIANSITILFLRTLISAPILFGLAYLFGNNTTIEALKISLPFLVINGVLLLGLEKIMWLEAIHRISITKGMALSSTTPFLTLIVAWVILHQAPTFWQITSLIPLTFGVLLLTNNLKLTENRLLA